MSTDRSLSELIKNTALFYKKITEQYQDADILNKVRLYIPEGILELKEEAQIRSLLEWFKKEYMSWIPNARCARDVLMKVGEMYQCRFRHRVEVHGN